MDEMLGVTKDNFKELNMFCSVKEIFLKLYFFYINSQTSGLAKTNK